MCCIIHRKSGDKQIKQEYLEMIISINKDGWGCSYVDNGKIITKKSMKMNQAINYIRNLEDKDIEFLFHARYTTLGKTNIDNCHPYDVRNGVMFHNGEIKGDYWNKNFSDSWHFAITISKFLGRKFPLSSILEKFKERIGPSRLAFLFNDGSIVKYGDWHEVDGVSYSKINWKWRLYSNTRSNHRFEKHNSYGGWEQIYDLYGYDYDNDDDNNLNKNNGGKTAYEKAVDSCNSLLLYPSVISNLTTDELCKLIKTYPDLFADYFYRKIDR